MEGSALIDLSAESLVRFAGRNFPHEHTEIEI